MTTLSLPAFTLMSLFVNTTYVLNCCMPDVPTMTVKNILFFFSVLFYSSASFL